VAGKDGNRHAERRAGADGQQGRRQNGLAAPALAEPHIRVGVWCRIAAMQMLGLIIG
jgi:hypothetical protein